MLKETLLIVLVVCALACSGQNLVPNPSFEEYSTCPSNPGQVYNCDGWTAWRNSPDYLNACATDETYGETLIDVPTGGHGYQEAATGSAFMGLYTFPNESNEPLDAPQEIIGCQLIEPLEAGVVYYLSFKAVWTAEGFKYSTNYATNGLGFRFTMQAFDEELDPIDLNNQPHFHIEEVLTDSVNWITFSGSFIPSQNFTHLAVGNHFDNEMTLWVNTQESGGSLAYYFLDDVCVSQDSLACFSTTQIEIFENSPLDIYPNPTSTTFTFQTDQPGPHTYSIFDITGKQAQYGRVEEGANVISVEALPAGLYVVRIDGDGGIRRGVIVKQ